MQGMKAVILCGGKGTRSYPFTEYFPKPMMPIAGTPILVHLMRSYADQGVNQFVLAAGHRQEVLVDYFTDKFSNWDIQIIDTGAESDTGERIRRCAPYLGERFFATYGDGLGDIDLQALLRFHHAHGGLATLTSVPLRSQYGTVACEGRGRVSQFHEKPVLREHWINAGFMIFERAAFNHWHGTSLESEVLPHLASKGYLFAFKHDGFWKSMDTSKDQAEIEKLLTSDSAPWRRGPKHAKTAAWNGASELERISNVG